MFGTRPTGQVSLLGPNLPAATLYWTNPMRIEEVILVLSMAESVHQTGIAGSLGGILPTSECQPSPHMPSNRPPDKLQLSGGLWCNPAVSPQENGHIVISLIAPSVTMASHGDVSVSAAFQRAVRCLNYSQFYPESKGYHTTDQLQ